MRTRKLFAVYVYTLGVGGGGERGRGKKSGEGKRESITALPLARAHAEEVLCGRIGMIAQSRMTHPRGCFTAHVSYVLPQPSRQLISRSLVQPVLPSAHQPRTRSLPLSLTPPTPTHIVERRQRGLFHECLWGKLDALDDEIHEPPAATTLEQFQPRDTATGKETQT